jgi:uncharacterized LabA/DUF88 family protein/cold shock CspA family protein
MKVGVYVDAENVRMCGGYGMQYNVLTTYAKTFGTVLKATCYIAEDYKRTQTDLEFKNKIATYYDVLKKYGFKIVKKHIKKYIADDGSISVKANMDMELAVDMITQSGNLDILILLTGDGDFIKPIQYIQSQGCCVIVVGFDYVNKQLKEVADIYQSGFLIEGLIPIKKETIADKWFRGTIHSFFEDKGYGFISSKEVHKIFKKETLFFHISYVDTHIPVSYLQPSDRIFEFQVLEKDDKNKLDAINIRLIKQ